jgi:transcriptional regulator with XRE-family HTH domain
MTNTPAPAAGENIAVLRKARGIGQKALAQRAGISLSLLSKIETGLRPATPPVIAAIAKALHVSTARIYGQPFIDVEQSDLLDSLRAAVRRHRLPREDVPPPGELAAKLKQAATLRADTDYTALLRILPVLLGQATANAFSSDGDAASWGAVADLYGCAYAVAHRMGQTDLADMIVSRQTWAATQTWHPEAEAAAAWNEAGTYQSAGQYADGLAVVEQAIVQFETAARLREDPESVAALGSLHLRGVVLASRHKDRNATADHLAHARKLAAKLPKTGDVLTHNLTFGPGNTAYYELAAHIELEQPDKAVEMSRPLMEAPPPGLAANRVGRFYIDAARAELAVKQLDQAEDALRRAFTVAPQMTAVHPMAREVLRVLFVMLQRSRPELLTMAQRAGLV